jgi:hypothetical protein
MAGAADVRFAQMMASQYKRLGDNVRRQQSSLQNRRNKMGFGRLVGAVGGGLLGLATGGGALIAAAGAGLGSRLGSELGQRSTKIDEVQQGSLFREKAAQARSEGVEAQRQLNRGANVSALSDAFSAYTLAGTGAGQKVGSKLTETFRPDWAMQQAMAAPGAGGFSIDQLNEGVRQKYGQTMIQRKPGEEYAKSIIPNATGVNISDKVTVPQDVVHSNLTPQSQIHNREKIINALSAENNYTTIGNQQFANVSGPQLPGQGGGSVFNINQLNEGGPQLPGQGGVFNNAVQTPPVTPGAYNVPAELANPAAVEAANTPYFGPYNTAPMQSPVGPYAPYQGTTQQNLQLADVLGLNTNRSIVDQLKRYGADSSMEARRRMFQDYFGGSY